MAKCMIKRNRLLVCPECGGKLAFDRSAVTSENGYIYRARRCLACAGVVRTRQAPEFLCDYEPSSVFTV